MRRVAQIIGVFLTVGTFFLLPQGFVFAERTPFRSASVVESEGNPPFTKLENCSETDGLTCERVLDTEDAFLIFFEFDDFNIPDESRITNLHIRMTGKSTVDPFMLFDLEIISACFEIGDFVHMEGFQSDTMHVFNMDLPLTSNECPEGIVAETDSFILGMIFFSDEPWSANIDNLEVAFEYTPPESFKTPLILIPGIGGSELQAAEDINWSQDNGQGVIFNNFYPEGEKVWVNIPIATLPGPDDYFDVLRMKTDGVNSGASLELTGSLFTDAYQGTINYLTDIGYELNETLFVFPYDWRKDLKETEALLDQKIESIKQQTGSEQVDIVAHSMGGLVARNYISDSKNAQKVRRLFSLGIPHFGSVNLLKTLRYGDNIGPSFLFGLIALDPSEIKDVIQNMIGGYQLMPTQRYYDFYTGNNNLYPFPFSDLRDIDGNGIIGTLDYAQIKTLLTNLDHNTSLFGPAEDFHELDNNLENTNGVKIFNIVGSGLPTLGQIVETYYVDFLGIKIPKKDEVSINGDGTVPLFSASLIDPDRNISFLGDASVFYTHQEHGALVAPGPALDLVKNILEDNTDLPSGVSTTPYSFSGTSLSVHSPVNIHVYDDKGRHTGPTESGDFEAEIPGSFFDTLDDAKFVWLPDDGIYNVRFESTGQGKFDFKIRTFENNENTETILYKDIPLTNDTTAGTVLDTTSNLAPTLHVDENGDGREYFQVDYFSILYGDVNSDYTLPILSVDVNPKTLWPPNNKMVDVRVAGTIIDDNPYLLKIIVDDEYGEVEPSVTTEYQTDIDQTIKLKASRKGGDKDGRTYTIRVFATDIAGNTSLSTFDVLVPHDQGKKK